MADRLRALKHKQVTQSPVHQLMQIEDSKDDTPEDESMMCCMCHRQIEGPFAVPSTVQTCIYNNI